MNYYEESLGKIYYRYRSTHIINIPWILGTNTITAKYGKDVYEYKLLQIPIESNDAINAMRRIYELHEINLLTNNVENFLRDYIMEYSPI